MWVQDPLDGIWLRKQPPEIDPARPHTARRSEPAIEVFALELAQRAGLPIALAKPATWIDEVSGVLERGVVSKRFHDSDESHHPGSELLGLPSVSSSSPTARARLNAGRTSATVEAVRAKLHELEQQHSMELLKPFARILVFDTWLGNGDRHSGNWALVTGSRGARLAPMYDPTACLGVELTDERAELTALTDVLLGRYCDRCPSGFGGGTNGLPGIKLRDALIELRQWPEWLLAVAELRPRFLGLAGDAASLLDDIPDEWLSRDRKRFASRVLQHRVTLVQ